MGLMRRAVLTVLVGAAGLTWAASPPELALAAPQTLSTPALPAGNARFVDAAVRDLLGRPSSDEDHDRWTDRLDTGSLRRSAFAADVARTPEWTRVVVSDLYVKILGRDAEPAGRDYWADRLVRGDRTADLAALLYASPEFYAGAGGTIPGYVDAVYQNILERPADAAGRAYWIDRLRRGSRTPIAKSFFLTVESNAKRVDALYAKLLNRPADADGRTYWAQRLVREDDIALAGMLTSSAEYYDAAQARYASATLTTIAGTVVVTPAQLVSSSYADDGSGQVVLAAGVSPPAVDGHLVVSDPADPTAGGISRVTAVSAGTAGRSILTIVGAGLADAFATGDVTSTVETPSALSEPTDRGADPGARAGDASCLTQLGTKVKPSIGIDVRNDSHMEWNVLRGTYDVQALLHLTPRFTASIAELSLQSSCSKELWSKGWPMNIFAGAIVIPGQIELSVDADLTAAWTGVNLSSTFSVPCHVGFRATQSGFTNRTGCDGVQRQLTFKPTTEGSLELAGGIRLSYELGVDKGGWARANVGLSAGPKIGIRAVADGTQSPWWKVGAFFEATLEADVELGPWNPSWTIATCCKKEWPWAQAGPGDTPPPPAPLAITTASLPTAVVGRPYSAALAASGGRGAKTWTAIGLPAGLSVTAGKVTGTPTALGTSSVALTVRDGAGQVATRQVTTQVVPDAAGPGLTRIGFDDAITLGPVVSGSGRYVAYTSVPEVSPGTYGIYDTYVLDRSTGSTQRLTEGNDHTDPIAMSADGSVVALVSFASDLVPGDDNDDYDLFVWDRDTDTIRRIAEHSLQASLSADGRTIAYTVYDEAGYDDVYVTDLVLGTTTQVTDAAEQVIEPAISADGRTVAFAAPGNDLAPGQDDDWFDVFVWDATSGAITRVTDGDRHSAAPSLSADGRFVAFSSDASGIAGPNPTHVADIYRVDRSTGATIRLTQGTKDSYQPVIADDGATVAFESGAPNLTSGDTNGAWDVFVWTSGGGLVRAPGGNASSTSVDISADGRVIAYHSAASDLVAGDTNGEADVFVWDRGP